MNRTIFFKLPVVLVFVSHCALASPPDPKKAGLDPERLAQIPVRMKSLVERGVIPGAVTLVARHGTVASLEAVGYQDVASKKPMRTDSIFQIMSMTKPVTAVALAMLVEEGKVSFSDPVEKHLPEFRGLWMIDSRDGDQSRTLKRPARPITIRDLLTHTSGMAGGPPDGARDLLSNLDKTLAEAVAIYSQQPLEFEPGTKWRYSNPGIATAGRIVEVVSDQPYEKFLEERIFKPLGMKDSFFFPTPDKIDRIALVYNRENGEWKRGGPETLAGDPGKYRKGAKYPCPECGLYSTAGDLFAFYQMMLNGGTYNGKRLLSRPMVELMTTLHTGNITPAGHSPGMGYGLAWTVVRDPIGELSLESIGTYGHGGAFGTGGSVDPKKDLIRVFMIGISGGNTGEARNAFMTISGSAIVE